MARIVMKFGGTSVADLDRIRNVARRVQREVEAGHQVAVVVSAMSGTTNQLVSWCQGLSALHDAREYDVVVATGEQVTTGLLAIALQDLGIEARSWAGWQIPIHTDGAHGKARIDRIDGAELIRRMGMGTGRGGGRDSRASAPITGSPPWDAADPILPRSRWPPLSGPTAATSIRMSMASIRPIRASSPRLVSSPVFPTRKCWNSPRSVPRFCKRAASSWR